MNKKAILATTLSLLFFPTAFLSAQGFTLSNDYDLPEGTISGIISNILSWLLLIFGILGVLGFVISGIIYLTSTGDENAISRAKQAMVYSILGVIVGLSGYLIMVAVQSMLGGSSTDF